MENFLLGDLALAPTLFWLPFHAPVSRFVQPLLEGSANCNVSSGARQGTHHEEENGGLILIQTEGLSLSQASWLRLAPVLPGPGS